MKTVLIIEDEINIRLFVTANLEVRGYIVVQADTGAAGLHALRTAPPDAVILDMRLPDLVGWDILDAMSTDPVLAVIPVILMTASAASTEPQRREYPNLAERLTKPASVETLLQAVQRVTG